MNQFRLVILGAVLVLALLACSQSVAKPTIVSFTSTPSIVTAGGTVRLEWQVIGASNLFVSPDVGVVTGNGTNITVNQTQSYTLTATNNAGSSQSVVQVTVQNLSTNRAPIAAFTASNLTTVVNDTLSFDASTSSDPDGDALTYTWTLGDTTNASGVTTSHAYSSAGSFTVTLTVSDGRLSNSVTRTVTISGIVISDAWRRLDTGTGLPNASFFQQLRVSTNARGDAVAIWEDYPARLRTSLYDASTDSWSAITTFSESNSFLNGARVRMLPNGTAVAVWLDVPVSGAAMSWKYATSSGAAWNPSTLILTLDADVQGITDVELVVNAAAQVGLAWHATRVTSPGFRKSYVSTLSANGWATQKLGDDSAGPAKIALDDNGRLIALYSSRTAATVATSTVFSKAFNFASGWETPLNLLTTNNQYTCATNTTPCYFVSAGRNGKTIALLWDAIGTFSGDGTLMSKVLNTNGDTWLTIADPVGTNTNGPLLRSDANGNAIAMYITRDAGNQGQLSSRRFDATTDTWTAVRNAPLFYATSALMNASGEVFAYGETAGPKTAVNLGADWSAVTAYEDFMACIPRVSAIGLDDNGIGLIVQICETPTVSYPLFIRAKKLNLR
jgi:PKD repeat protein